jgi:hypothetical protein
MANGVWRRENKPGIEFDRPLMWLLLPGVVIQWFLYMFPSGGLGRVASDTRISRSRLMTYVLSAAFYLCAIGLLALLIKG